MNDIPSFSPFTGLPVEYEIDKAHNITGPADVREMGIANYNALCRGIVQVWCYVSTIYGDVTNYGVTTYL